MLQPKYLARKVGWLLVTFYIVATVTFLLFHVMPGNPVLLLARSGHLTHRKAAEVSKLYGLNHSLPDQYLGYLDNLVHGQLGIWYAYHQPVSQLMGQYLGNTILLLFVATLITIVLGTIVVGHCLAANRRGREVRRHDGCRLGDRLEPADLLGRDHPRVHLRGLGARLPDRRHGDPERGLHLRMETRV